MFNFEFWIVNYKIIYWFITFGMEILRSFIGIFYSYYTSSNYWKLVLLLNSWTLMSSNGYDLFLRYGVNKTNGTTVFFIFHTFFSYLARSNYFSIFSTSLSSTIMLYDIAKLIIWHSQCYLSMAIMSEVLAVIKWGLSVQ